MIKSTATALLTALAFVSLPAMAAVTLQPSLSAPTELEIGQHEEFVVSVKNAGNTAASGVVVRMRFHTSLTLAYAGPNFAVFPEPPSPCSVVTEPFGNQQNIRQVKCTIGALNAGVTKSVRLVVKAPSSGYTQVQHQLRATAGTVLGTSNGVTTRYRHYDQTVVPGTTWNTEACGGSAPINFDVCPPSSEITSQLTMNSGGTWNEAGGSTGTWTQTSPSTIDFMFGTDVIHMSAISSRCFRGTNTSPYSSPYTTSTTWYTVFKLCLQP